VVNSHLRGCVTPKIIANLKETLTGSSGEIDYTLLDGYEELSPENQAKVRKALEQGHVADSEWKGVRHGCPAPKYINADKDLRTLSLTDLE